MNAVVKHILSPNTTKTSGADSPIRLCGQPQVIKSVLDIIDRNGEKINHYEEIKEVLKRNLQTTLNDTKAYDLFMKMMPQLKVVHTDYAKYRYSAKNKGIIKDTTFGLFNKEKEAIYTNIETDALLTEERAARGEYQVTIHELWHNIDYLAGKKLLGNSVYFSHSYYGQIIRAINEDIERKVMLLNEEEPSRQKFYNSFYNDIKECKRTDSISSNKDTVNMLNAYYLVFDILDGTRYANNRENNNIGWEDDNAVEHIIPRIHTKEDWEQEGTLATECFANFGGIRGVSQAAFKIMLEYLPKTCKVYEVIIDRLWEVYCKNNPRR